MSHHEIILSYLIFTISCYLQIGKKQLATSYFNLIGQPVDMVLLRDIEKVLLRFVYLKLTYTAAVFRMHFFAVGYSLDVH